MKRKERLRYYSLYTVIFAVLSFLVFFIFIKNGRSFVYESNGEDGIAQHYMSLVYLGNYLRDILHNLFINHKLIIPQWDMTLGLGADVITTMNYYVLGDPLNLLAVFVSPEKTEYLSCRAGLLCVLQTLEFQTILYPAGKLHILLWKLCFIYRNHASVFPESDDLSSSFASWH